jgi:hypothetical protein
MATRETSDLIKSIRRQLTAVANRIAEGDDDLPDLDSLKLDVEKAVQAAVLGRRRHWPDESWTEIGRMLGISRQAAQKRFGGGA